MAVSGIVAILGLWHKPPFNLFIRLFIFLLWLACSGLFFYLYPLPPGWLASGQPEQRFYLTIWSIMALSGLTGLLRAWLQPLTEEKPHQ